MKQMPAECCARCKFFIIDEDEQGLGACRRFPPVLRNRKAAHDLFSDPGDEDRFVYTAAHDAWAHPRMSFGDWCGEFVAGDGISAAAHNALAECRGSLATVFHGGQLPHPGMQDAFEKLTREIRCWEAIIKSMDGEPNAT